MVLEQGVGRTSVSEIRFCVFLATLLVVQTILRRMKESLTNNELKRIWKEAVVA
jgi:hypothetical protein